MKIYGIGHAIMDLIVESRSEVLNQLGIDAGSMTLIDEEESRNLLNFFSPDRFSSGGSVGNTLAALGKFGTLPTFMGVVANDSFGAAYVDDLTETQVAYQGIGAGEDISSTGHCIVVVTEDGQRTMFTNLGSSSKFTEHLDLDPIIGEIDEEEKIIYLEGYLFDSPSGDRIISSILSNQRKDLKIAITLSDFFLVDRHRKRIWEILESGRVSLLFANEAEITGLCEVESAEAAALQVAKLAEEVAVTRGDRGALVVSGGEVIYSATRATSVVDTTGAGDLFAAGYLYGKYAGRDVETCSRFGNICAGEIITHFGARLEIDLRSQLI